MTVIACSSTGPRTPAQFGALAGTVTASWFAGTDLAGVSVTVTPKNGTPLPPVTTAADGSFLVPHVPLDSSYVDFANVPAGCTPFRQGFLLQFPGDTAAVDEIVPCQGGAIHVNVVGLAGVMPRTLAFGPNNGEWDVFGSGNMTGLPPGNYTIQVDPTIILPGPIVDAVYGRTVSDTSLVLTSNGSDTVTITVGAKRGGTQELWIAMPDGSSAAAFTQAQLLGSGTLAPATTLGTSPAAVPAPRGIAVDTGGNIWVAGGRSIAQFTPAQLGTGGAPAPRTVITMPQAGSSATALLTDYQGNLWVADSGGAAVYGYTASQLATSGSPVPAYQISDPGVLRTPVSLAAGGGIWIADEASGVVWAYNENQIADATTGAPIAPSLELTATPGTSRPVAIVADGTGDLWVASGSDTLALFSELALSALEGDSAPPPSTVFIVPGANAQVASLALGGGGDLWVTVSGTNQLVRYAGSEIPSATNLPPATTFNLGATPSGLAFDATSIGLGLTHNQLGTTPVTLPLTANTRHRGARAGHVHVAGPRIGN